MLKLSKLLAIAVAAMALVPSWASAQESVELRQETGEHCPSEVNDVDHLPSDVACSINAEQVVGTTLDLYQHVMGVGEVRFTQCRSHFEGAFNENGQGYLYDQIIEEDAVCGREPCEESEYPPSPNPHRNLAWPAQISEAGPTGTEEETLRMTFCLRVHSNLPREEQPTGTPCTLDLQVERSGHDYLIRTPPDVPSGQGGAPCINLGGVVELEGRWSAGPGDGHPSFEVHHLNDEVG